VLTVDYDRLDLRAGMTVLDLGCGEGRHAFEAYRRGGRVVAVDWGVHEVETTKRWLGAIAEAGEAPAGARYEVVRGDLTALPVPDASVDRVIASEVLEHIPDDATAFAEIARVLKPGGRVAVTVPRYGPERICWALSDAYHANEGGHVRIYTAGALRTRLPRPGSPPAGATTPMRCTPRTGGSSARSAWSGTPPSCAPTTGCSSGT
jgi:SAM-dependent methyltransferase